jgi:GAF domain-containing protein
MVVDREAFTGSLRALRADVADQADADLAVLLQRATSATQTITAVDGAGLLLPDDDGMLHWVAVTSRAAHAFERAQLGLGEGPGLDALAEDQEVISGDLTADRRWPRLSGSLAGQPIRAVLSVPVRLRGRPFGALDVHASAPHGWNDEEVRAVSALTDVIADLLEAAARAEEQAGRAAQLEYALEARVVIEQAKGVLIATEGLSGPEAFQRLRGTARATRRKVVDVAQDVLKEASGTPGASRLLAAERLRRIAAEEAAERLEQLQAVTAAFAAALTTAEVAEVAVTQAAAAAGAGAALVAVVAPGGRLEIEASSGLDRGGTIAPGGPRRDRHVPLTGDSPVADAMRELLPVWLRSRAEQADRYSSPAAPGHEALACIPLTVDDHPVGVLALGYDQPRPFDADEQDLILALAAQCAQALERSRRAEHSQWERIAAVVAQDRLAFLTEASGILAAALDPDTMLDQLGRLAIPRVADLCLVLLTDEASRTLRPRVVAARDDATLARVRTMLDEEPLRLGNARVAGAVAQSGRTRLLSATPDPPDGDPASDHATASMRALGVTSAIVAPLRGRSRVHGVLVLAGQREDLPYTEMDLTLAETLGRRVGVALETLPRTTLPIPNPRAEGA